MTIRTASRRAPMRGDWMIVDYPELNAIVIVEDESEDPSKTEGIGRPGSPAYLMRYIIGVGMNASGAFDMQGEIWLQDDPSSMSIVGVNGCRLPSTFFGFDLAGYLQQHGVNIEWV